MLNYDPDRVKQLLTTASHDLSKADLWNIVEQVRTEYDVLQSHFNALANHTPVLIWVVDADRQCTYVNQPWLNFTGRTLEQELGDGWIENLHPADRSVLVAFAEAIDARRTFKFEYRLRYHDGSYRWMLDQGAPQYDHQGEFVGYIGSCIDISERKEAERDAFELELEKQRTTILASFIRNASHEFRTPLSVINTSTYALQHLTDPDERRERIRRIEQQVEQINLLIEDLATIVRLESETGTTTHNDLPVHQLIEAAVYRFERKAQAKNLTLHVDMQPDMAQLEIHGNWDDLQIALEQLLDNAVRYTPKHGTITVRCTRADSQLSLEVIDNGIGITTGQQDRIFEQFYRADEAHSTPGFGLGLAIVKRITEQHNGSVTVSSTPGNGSTFTLSLPL